MKTRARIVSKAGAALSAMGLVVALSVASPTLAQKGETPPKPEERKDGPVPPIISIPEKGEPDLPPVPADSPAGPIPVDPPARSAPAELPARPAEPVQRSVDPLTPAPGTTKPDPFATPTPGDFGSPLDKSLTPAGNGAAPNGEGADPEKAAQEFMDKTRREADAAIKSLTAEAESLRARLKKVEAGLKRWQALQTALDDSSGQRAAAAARRGDWRAKDEPDVPPRRRIAGPANVADRDPAFAPLESAPNPRTRARGEAIQKK
jgi:hypothetical protein